MIVYKEIKQGTDEWLELRGGVLTGTKLKGALGGKQAQLTQIYELIGEEFAPLEDFYKSPAMERGNILEEIAKSKFEEIYNKKVIEVGFCKSDKYKDEFGEWFGFSPDGLIEIEGKYKEAIEIKCPLSKNFVKYSIEGVIPAEYEKQVYSYFLINEDLEKLYFLIYHPDFYLKDKKMKVIEVTREQILKELEELDKKIIDFRKLWIENIKLLQK